MMFIKESNNLLFGPFKTPKNETFNKTQKFIWNYSPLQLAWTAFIIDTQVSDYISQYIASIQLMWNDTLNRIIGFDELIISLHLMLLLTASAVFFMSVPFFSKNVYEIFPELNGQAFGWYLWGLMGPGWFICQSFTYFPTSSDYGDFFFIAPAVIYIFFDSLKFSLSILYLQCFILLIAVVVGLLYYSETVSDYRNAYIYSLLTAIVTFLTILISANDWIVFFLSLEGASALFAVLVMEAKISGASDSAINYYAMSSIITSFLTVIIIFLVYYTGGTNFYGLEYLLSESLITYNSYWEVKYLIWLFLTVFLFKFGSWPFGFWVPDTYEGSNISTIGLASLLTKVGIWSSFITIVESFFLVEVVSSSLSSMLSVLAVISLIVGCIGALWQSSINRFIGYTTINQSGFLLLALAAGTHDAFQSLILYLFFYFAALSLFFLIWSFFVKRNWFNEYRDIRWIWELKEIYRLSPKWFALLSLSLFSMAGLPPFAGFWAKFNLWRSVINSVFNNDDWLFSQYLLLFAFFISLLISILSTYYYIRIVVSSVIDVNVKSVNNYNTFLVNHILISSTRGGLSVQEQFSEFVSNAARLIVLANPGGLLKFRHYRPDTWYIYLFFTTVAVLLSILSFWWLDTVFWNELVKIIA